MSSNKNIKLDTYHGRLKWARTRLGLTQVQVSGLVGMSQPAYSLLEKKGAGSEKTASLARVVKVSPQWLETGLGEPEEATPSADDFIEIRRVEVRVSASADGVSISFVNTPGEPIYFSRTYLDQNGLSPNRLYATRISGQNMEGTVFDGDILVFNTASTKPKDGVAFLVSYEGEPTLSRMVRDAGQWWLTSDHPDKARYPRKLFDASVSVIGEAVRRISSRV